MGQHSRVYQFKGMRERQEDSHAVAPEIPSGKGLLCAAGVFDGVGSSKDGHVAATVAAYAFLQALLSLCFMRDRALSLRDLARESLRLANEFVVKLRSRDKYAAMHPALRPAAVGAIAVVSTSSQVAVASAGDVVAFLQKGDNLIPITKSHTASADDEEPGAVTRFLGQEDLLPQVVVGDLGGADLWLMSDGAYGPLLRSGFVGDPGDFFKRAKEGNFWDNATAVGISLVPAGRDKNEASKSILPISQET